jgi:hypothetical protein
VTISNRNVIFKSVVRRLLAKWNAVECLSPELDLIARKSRVRNAAVPEPGHHLNDFVFAELVHFVFCRNASAFAAQLIVVRSSLSRLFHRQTDGPCAMRRTRSVEYGVEDDGSLRRTVLLSDGTQYVHRCTRGHFEQIAHAFQDQHGHTLAELAKALDLPFTQVNVAMEFLKERGCIVTRYKRHTHAASNFVYEDAMIEYLALKDGAQPT